MFLCYSYSNRVVIIRSLHFFFFYKTRIDSGQDYKLFFIGIFCTSACYWSSVVDKTWFDNETYCIAHSMSSLLPIRKVPGSIMAGTLATFGVFVIFWVAVVNCLDSTSSYSANTSIRNAFKVIIHYCSSWRLTLNSSNCGNCHEMNHKQAVKRIVLFCLTSSKKLEGCH